MQKKDEIFYSEIKTTTLKRVNIGMNLKVDSEAFS